MVDELRLRIARMASPYLLDLRWMNGQPFLHLGGMANHRSSTDVIDLFEHAEALLSPCIPKLEDPFDG
ncbi:Imm7 family immunity protein [Streptomyces xanthophaeus]